MTTNTTLTECVYDPLAAHAVQGFDVWLYIAYTAILLSYININILVFRFWLIISAIFFILWGFAPERAIQLDSVLFNLVYIVINIIYSIPLARQVWPVKLTEFEDEIYRRDFHEQMNRKQFKRFINEFKQQSLGVNNTQLCSANNDFEHLIYIAKLEPGWKIILNRDGENKVNELMEGAWIGTIEYMSDMERKPTDPLFKWVVSAMLIEDRGEDGEIKYQGTQSDQKFIPRSEVGCIVYYIELKVSYRKKFLNFL